MCIENMQRGTQSTDNSAATELAPLEMVEMLVTIFCFLKDSSAASQTLLDDFKSCQGYIFLSEFLLKLEQVLEFTLEIYFTLYSLTRRSMLRSDGMTAL